MRIIRLFLASVFLLTGCCGLLWSQTSLTSLRGTITDPTGALIPGATVRIENKTTTLKSIETSTNSGEYVFAQIVPGTYVVTVDSPGFGSQSKAGRPPREPAGDHQLPVDRAVLDGYRRREL